MQRSETAKATIIPLIRITNSITEKLKPNLRSLSAEAPSIAGTARKNVNSEATVLDVPIEIPPRIVEPERDVPGISERAWKRPIRSASL